MFKNIHLLFNILILTFFCVCNSNVAADGGKLFTIEFNNTSFNACLEEISKQSGYEIIVIDGFMDNKINIRLKNVNIEQSLSKILRGINHAIKWDDENHQVTLFLFSNSSARPIKQNPKGVTRISSTKSPNTNSIDQKTGTSISNEYDRNQAKDLIDGQSKKHPVLENKIKLDVSGKDISFNQGTTTGYVEP